MAASALSVSSAYKAYVFSVSSAYKAYAFSEINPVPPYFFSLEILPIERPSDGLKLEKNHQPDFGLH